MAWWNKDDVAAMRDMTETIAADAVLFKLCIIFQWITFSSFETYKVWSCPLGVFTKHLNTLFSNFVLLNQSIWLCEYIMNQIMPNLI